MRWFQVSINSQRDNLNLIENTLTEAGALSVSISNADNQTMLFQSSNEDIIWEHVRITGLFDENTDIESVKDFIYSVIDINSIPDLHIEQIEDRDWTTTWMENFKPIKVGDRMWIVPEWYTPPEPSAINILINPCQAFGTGTHPTTALCLEWIAGANVLGLDVIDYGCGSGILAIAMEKSGAGRVWAVDNDPQAIIVTGENIKKNMCGPRIVTTTPESINGLKVDLIIANILATPLITLAHTFAGMVHKGGTVILSGILDEQADEVKKAYEPWFDIIKCINKESWMLIEGRLR
ncbi:MAG: 50S ribosomal protein L11 methyltransferase [Nitrospirae bacterium]|nr:50S ribosomal protein L11 methyltransferase [Nitrospirota bacterium]